MQVFRNYVDLRVSKKQQFEIILFYWHKKKKL